MVNLIKSYYSLLPASDSGLMQLNQSFPYDSYNWSVKADHNLTSKDALEFRYFDWKRDGSLNSVIIPASTTGSDRNYVFSGTWRRIFSPKVVNEVKATYMHLNSSKATPATLPDVSISGFTGIGNSSNVPQAFIHQDVQFAEQSLVDIGTAFPQSRHGHSLAKVHRLRFLRRPGHLHLRGNPGGFWLHLQRPYEFPRTASR